MIKYNNSNINDWYYDTSNIIKVYRNNAVCYYKISDTPPTPPTPTSKWIATYVGGTTSSAECDSTSAITSGEITLSNLVSVEIGDCVASIGLDAFMGCRSLTSCTIGNSVTSIAGHAFEDCTSLTSITVSATTPPTLGNDTFYNTNNCPIYVPCESVEAYKSAWSDYASRITCVNPPVQSFKWKATYSDSSVTSAECDASSAITENEINSTNLASVEIGDCVTSIGDRAFRNCSGLTSITIPNSVTTISDYAFRNCSSLTSIDIPSGVTSIGSYAFNGCISLTSIDIPDSVTSIAGGAFYNCSGLTSIIFEATTPPTLGVITLSNTNDCPIYVPSESVEVYKSTWSNYASRIQAIPNS